MASWDNILQIRDDLKKEGFSFAVIGIQRKQAKPKDPSWNKEVHYESKIEKAILIKQLRDLANEIEYGKEDIKGDG
tara:strand:- start:6224 stop:6451 length:228 start_codon:yes stop_codon:yes gene_type:complete